MKMPFLQWHTLALLLHASHVNYAFSENLEGAAYELLKHMPTFKGDPRCFPKVFSEFSFETCCFPAPLGQERCWTGTLSPQRCCGTLGSVDPANIALKFGRKETPCLAAGITCEECCIAPPDITNPWCWDESQGLTAAKCCARCWRGQAASAPVFVPECQASEESVIDAEIFSLMATDAWRPARLYILSCLKRLVFEKQVPGAVVELGCKSGKTSVLLRRVIEAFNNSARPFHVYDSFAGLPGRNDVDGRNLWQDNKGAMAASVEMLVESFNNAEARLPDFVHKGFFKDILNSKFPDPIAFAFFDGDLHESITDSFGKVYHKMSPGGVILVHDYVEAGRFPGVRVAIEDFLAHKPETVDQCFGDVALIVKK